MFIKDLFDQSGTDKGKAYGYLYDVLLAPIRNDIKVLIEIGIGTLVPDALSTMHNYAAPGYRSGASLRCWRDYLPNAEIHGIDVQPDTQFKEDRIWTYLQDSTKEQARALFRLDYADIIVDDGSHDQEAQVNTFRNFMPILKSGGLYVLEDVFPQHEKRIRSVISDHPFFIVRSNLRPVDVAVAVIRK